MFNAIHFPFVRYILYKASGCLSSEILALATERTGITEGRQKSKCKQQNGNAKCKMRAQQRRALFIRGSRYVDYPAMVIYGEQSGSKGLPHCSHSEASKAKSLISTTQSPVTSVLSVHWYMAKVASLTSLTAGSLASVILTRHSWELTFGNC